jgi:UDP-glucose 4-epimerase
MKKIVVTGAAGFIGSHLCERLLSAGHRVVGIDSINANYDERIKRENLAAFSGHEQFSLQEESLNTLNLDAVLSGAEYVFHMAAQPGVRQSWHEHFDSYVDANIRATQRLCEIARNKSIKKFVFASSSSVYGETHQLPMGESHPTQPVSPYGVTKLSSEALCLLYKRSFNLPVVCLRFFTVYGPRQRPDMAFHRFIKSALDGAAIEVYGNGTQSRDFTYIADIVEANCRAMEYDGEYSVFNVGGGSRVTLNEALDIIGAAVASEMDVTYMDPVKGDVTHTYADISLARKELGYEPKANLREGIGAEVDWVRFIRKKLKTY